MTKEKEPDMFENVELQTPENTDMGVKDVIMQSVNKDTPTFTDPEWNDHVMSLFEPNELINGRPVAAGLRRVSELVLGPIIYSGPTQVFPPKNDNEHGRATVVFKVEFQNGMIYSDVADCWEGNTDDMFCAYAVATASTRAEARALRKALRIRTIAAEEVTNKDTANIVRNISKQTDQEVTKGEYEDQGRMTDAQLNFIDVKCKQLNIDGKKFLQEIFNVSTRRKISKRIASESIDKLNKFQRKAEEIPESILGYYEEWRN